MQSRHVANTGKIPELNWLRGIAAIVVMLFHFTTRYDQILGHVEPYIINVTYGGNCSIFFFMLSGMLSVYTPKKSKCRSIC